jgi:subtilase family serine protease
LGQKTPSAIALAGIAALVAGIGVSAACTLPAGQRTLTAHAATASYGVGQIRHAYGFDRVTETGLDQVAAVVEAYHNPAAPSDLLAFSEASHLTIPAGLDAQHPCSVKDGPHPCFQVLTQGVPLEANRAWADESSTSAEWLHAVAGGADLLLVEAASDHISDLMAAVGSAVAAGASIVLMTWGMPENPEFRAYDQVFDAPNVTFVAASGDSGHAVNYPAVAPRVIAVGGTELTLDAAGNRIGHESAWSGSGGGISAVEPQPAFQSSWARGAAGRAVPDVAIVAYPGRGFASYSTGAAGPGWRQAEGTSVSAALWAGLIALIAERLGNRSLAAPSTLYAVARATGSGFLDVVGGANGACGDECSSRRGFDQITGLGRPDVPSLLGNYGRMFWLSRNALSGS